jgi:hypothetical protein
MHQAQAEDRKKNTQRGKKIKEIDNGEASLSLSKIRYYAIDHGRK